MPDQPPDNTLTRRALLTTAGKATVVAIAAPFVDLAAGGQVAPAAQAPTPPLNAIAGVDRVVMRHGRTYLNAWAGYGAPPQRTRRRPGTPEPPMPPPLSADAKFRWSKRSGPGTVAFADPAARTTTATFSEPGEYVIEFATEDGSASASSSLLVKVELPPPAEQLMPVVTRRHTITSRFWASRARALITSWIPHCIAQINRTDIPPGQGDGGIDNFVEAAKALRGEPHGAHKGYVFSNAWVHQTVESICLALMVDPQGDKEIARRAGEDARDARGLDPEDPRGAASRRLPADGVHAARHGARLGIPGGVARAVDGALVAGRAPEPRGIRRGLLHRVGDQSLYDDGRPRPPALRRGEAPRGLLGGSHRPAAEAGMVRRAPGDGAGAGAVWPVRQRGGEAARRGHGPGRPLRRACEVPARLPQGRLRVRPEPPAGAAAVRSGGPRGPRGLHLLGHGGRRGRDPRRGLPERRQVALGQHRPQEVLPDGRRGQRRDLRRVRAGLLAAQQRLLRGLLELRRDLLPVEAAPRVSPRPVRRPLRADALQRAVRGDGPGRHGLLLHEPARREPAADAVAQLPVLRRQHRADAADAAHVDVLEGGATRCT